MNKSMIITLLLLAAAAAPALAQAPAPPPQPPAAPPTLVFEREVFEYPVGGRRDPFKPLNTDQNTGPLFTELKLTGTIVMANPSESLATFQDLSKKQYRLRRGDRIGNATIQFIDKTRVVFSVEEFGMKRQEVLSLTRAGA